ncbi:MAG: 6-hydroxymethylpterin diphosphokinase MptE-like protein [bacterium]
MMENDNAIYNNNRNFIKQFHGTVYAQYDRCMKEEKKADDNFEFDFIKGKKGHTTFTVKTPDGRVVHGHSIYDPVREWERRFENVSFDENDRIVVLGFGLGYHLEYLLQKAPNSKIIVIEPFTTLFDEALQRRNLIPLFSSQRLIVALNMASEFLSYALSQGVNAIRMPDFHVYSLPYAQLVPELNELIPETIVNLRDFLLFNFYTGLFAGDQFFKNTVDNFPVAARNPGITELTKKLSKRPAFVIAPGPSLENNVDQLNRVKGNAIIIAVDTATKPLKKHGIVPDIIATLDYQTKNYEKLKGVDTSTSILVPAIEVCPEIPREHKGKCFTYYHSPTTAALYDPVLGNKGVLGSGGSVLTDAFNLAVLLGADPVILVGVDLGFPGKKWYADGSFEEGEFTRNIQEGKVELIEIPDIHGNPMYTYRSFHAFLKYFNTYIPTLNINVVDATEGGARIKGTKIMELSDAIDEYLTEPYDGFELLCDIHSRFTPPDKDELLEKFEVNIKKFKEITGTCKKGIDECNKALRLIKKEQFDSTLLRKLKKIQKMQSELKSEGKYLDFIGSSLERMMLNIFHFEEKEDDPRDVRYRKIIEVSKDSFEHMKKATKYAYEHFQEIAETIEKEGL